LEHALEPISTAIGSGRRLLFFAHGSFDPNRYTELMQTAVRGRDLKVVPAHKRDDLDRELHQADAIFVGGGNSFRLLKAFQDARLLDAVRSRVHEGLPYLAASAGTNLACPTIRTTNDMPIVEPRSLGALGLVPFQINPHYPGADSRAPIQGESRDQRMTEFLHQNDVPIVALREGAWLERDDGSILVGGATNGRLFQRGATPRELPPGSDVSALLNTEPHYDSPLE
jgi:dipeptidase E